VADPYRVLGVDRSWSLADIERRYREQVRASHPDNHAGEGADAVAEANRRTIELNQAMAELRESHHDRRRPVDGFTAADGDDFGVTFGWTAAAEEDERIHQATHWSVAQPCPMCDEMFVALDDYLAHVAMVHLVDLASFAPRGGHRRRRRPGRVTLVAVLQWTGYALLGVGALAVLAWHATLPPAEAASLTPWVVVVALVMLAAAARLLYRLVMDDRPHPSRRA
jgi:curved DNA-binding protein CbpA